jgi:hypothetical protein
MITPDQICEIVLKQKLPYVRIEDLAGHCLYTIEDTDNPDNTAATLRDTLKYFTQYGSLKIKLATETEHRGNFRGANQYTVKVSENSPVKAAGALTAVPVNDPVHQFTSMMQMVAMFNNMAGVNRNSDIELEKLKLQFELDRQRREWAKLDEDPIKKYIGAAPLIMSAMGMKQEVITATLQQMANTDQMFNKPAQLATSMSGTATQTLETDAPTKFEDLQKISLEEKNTRIQNLLDKVCAKVSAEEMIIILETIEMQPALLPDYVRLFNISKKVPVETITALLKGVELKPEFAATALSFLPKPE